MANPWDEYAAASPPVATPQAPAAPWEAYAEPAAPKTVFKGSVIPMSQDDRGQWKLDMSAGLPGMIGSAAKAAWSGITAPGDVYNGKLDPGSDEAIKRSFELASIASPVNPAVRAGDRAVPGAAMATRGVKVTPPTAEELRAAGSAGFDQVRDMGVDYSSKAVRDLASGVRGQLEKDGILGELAPKTFSILQKLEAAPEGSVAPIQGVVAARRALGLAAKDFSNPTEQLAAKRIISALDGLIENPDAASVVAGPAAAAGAIQKEANANWAAGARSNRINDIEDAAALRAKTANSGANTDNSIRGRIASLLLDPKKSAGYSADELTALREVAEGNVTRNSIRTLGNLLGGGGLGGALTGAMGAAGGASVGGPIGAAAGAALPIMGYGAKTLGNALTRGSLKAGDELVRSRSPLFQSMQSGAGVEAIPSDSKMLLLRALLAGQSGQQ